MPRFGPFRPRLPGALAIGALGAALLAPVAAQDDDASEASASAVISGGTCDALTAEPRYPLTPLAPGFFEDETGTAERVGAEAAAAIVSSGTEVQVALDDLLAEPHAIVVPANADQPAACGEIGGYLAEGVIIVGLKTLEGADLAGVAFLWDDRQETSVELHLGETLLGRAAQPVDPGDDAADADADGDDGDDAQDVGAAGGDDADDGDDGAASQDDADDAADDGADDGSAGTDDAVDGADD